MKINTLLKEERERELFNSFNNNYDYESYLEHCEINETEPEEENSQDFWEYVDMMIDDDYLILKEELSRLNKKYDTFILYGHLGLWNGRPDIYPKTSCDIIDLLEKITQDNLLLTVYYDKIDKTIEIEQSHHDGCNCFTIKALKTSALTDYLFSKYENGEFTFQNKRESLNFLDILAQNRLILDIEIDF